MIIGKSPEASSIILKLVVKPFSLSFRIDSGLSLTTVRDATEVESDREMKFNQQDLLRNSKPYRSMPVKRNNHNSDSDDVFDEVIFLMSKPWKTD